MSSEWVYPAGTSRDEQLPRPIRVWRIHIEQLCRRVEKLVEQIEASMSLFGYARMSTTEQDLSMPVAALKAAGCQTIRSEKKSGTERGARTELQVLLDFLRQGDSLAVARIDRLARSMKDLQDIVHELKDRVSR